MSDASAKKFVFVGSGYHSISISPLSGNSGAIRMRAWCHLRERLAE